MNALARLDLQTAYDRVREIETGYARTQEHVNESLAIAVEKLCHVINVLDKENKDLQRQIDELHNLRP